MLLSLLQHLLEINPSSRLPLMAALLKLSSPVQRSSLTRPLTSSPFPQSLRRTSTLIIYCKRLTRFRITPPIERSLHRASPCCQEAFLGFQTLLSIWADQHPPSKLHLLHSYRPTSQDRCIHVAGCLTCCKDCCSLTRILNTRLGTRGNTYEAHMLAKSKFHTQHWLKQHPEPSIAAYASRVRLDSYIGLECDALHLEWLTMGGPDYREKK
jgi:hypothetical protein